MFLKSQNLLDMAAIDIQDTIGSEVLAKHAQACLPTSDPCFSQLGRLRILLAEPLKPAVLAGCEALFARIGGAAGGILASAALAVGAGGAAMAGTSGKEDKGSVLVWRSYCCGVC